MTVTAPLRTEGLTRFFGKRAAVQDLNLEVEEGDLYGFLGPNGAGKTTTLRLALDLVRPTSGRALLFGREVRANFKWAMRQVGALIESPAFYPHLSVYRNLEVLARLSGRVDRIRLVSVLERVGLGDRLNDPARTLSQGMRQRLGIATALFDRPRLAILDEPVNGLDPQGIHDIRALILELNRADGTTFVISSHLLHEVELICNRVAIVREGRLAAQEKTDALLRRAPRTLRIVASPRDRARTVLAGVADQVRDESDGSITAVLRGADTAAGLNAALVQAGIQVEEFSPRRATLEDLFLAG